MKKVSELLPPGPWWWGVVAEIVSCELPILHDAENSRILDFGNYEGFDQRAGTPPSDELLILVKSIPEMVCLLEDIANTAGGQGYDTIENTQRAKELMERLARECDAITERGEKT